MKTHRSKFLNISKLGKKCLFPKVRNGTSGSGDQRPSPKRDTYFGTKLKLKLKKGNTT